MNTLIKHNSDCSRVFKKYDAKCPRCQQLEEGAPPREGWQTRYFANKKHEEDQQSRAIKNHNCERSNCGPICTAFDY